MGETFPGSYIFVDGSNVGDISPDVLREREMMAVEGIVLVNLLFNQKGQLSCEPQIHTRGFLVGRDEEELKLITRSKIQEVLIHANGNLQKDVEKAVRNVLYTETRRRPLVLISVCEVN